MGFSEFFRLCKWRKYNDTADCNCYNHDWIFFMEELMVNRLNFRQINHVRTKFTISSFLEGLIMYSYSLSLLISKIRTCKDGRTNCLYCEIKRVFLRSLKIWYYTKHQYDSNFGMGLVGELTKMYWLI